MRNYKATDKRLLDELDRDVGEKSWKDWKHKVKRKTFVSLYLCICSERERLRLRFDAFSVSPGVGAEDGRQREVF